MEINRQPSIYWYLLPAIALLVLMPETALAQSSNPVTEGLQWIATQLTSTWARTVAIIACAVMGYLAWAQYLTVRTVGMFILGCVFVFGASSFVDTFSSEGVDVGGFSYVPVIEHKAYV